MEQTGRRKKISNVEISGIKYFAAVVKRDKIELASIAVRARI